MTTADEWTAARPAVLALDVGRVTLARPPGLSDRHADGWARELFALYGRRGGPRVVIDEAGRLVGVSVLVAPVLDDIAEAGRW